MDKDKSVKSNYTGLEVAVIGMAGQFPGAQDIREYWDKIKNGVISVSFLTPDELDEAGVSPEVYRRPNYVKAKAYLEDINSFDSYFFNYTPSEAQVMDPQLRLIHQCTWHALEDAGIDPYSYPGLIGLYAGYTPNVFWKVANLFRIGSTSEHMEIENLNSNHFATLLCYKMNLKGPGIAVNTACSTSLVAVHLACRALLTGESDIVLAGGVGVSLPQKSGYLYQEGMVLSPDGFCRPFDAKAAGTISGDGVGIVVLKRLKKALKDRDHIYAIIKGTAVNNDGNRKAGYSAPSVEAQAEVIRSALRMGEVEAESITYIETHGTATPLGDPIEIEALKKAFHTEKKNFCRLGFVKANIGHLDAAAGIAGFIKTVMALYHREIPPAVNYKSPNPKIDLENSPFIIDTSPKEWQVDGLPRRAGVSAFGIGGTNVHVVLEEAPAEPGTGTETQAVKEHEDADFHLIALSARTSTALEHMTRRLGEFIAQNPLTDLGNVAFTLHTARAAFNHRRISVCSNSDDAARLLLSPHPPHVRTAYTDLNNRPLVFMFPGLGTQYIQMGTGLYQTQPLFRDTMEHCFSLYRSIIGEDIRQVIFPASSSSPDPIALINRIDIAQPLVFIFEYALMQTLLNFGIKPHSMIGYSFGEYTAACTARVFSLEDTLSLIAARGETIRSLPPGAMLSVPLTVEETAPFISEPLSIAIDNGASCIVAGPLEAVDRFELRMKEKKYICIRIATSHAIHSPMMKPAVDKFLNHLRRLTFNKPQIPFISNVTGKWITLEDSLNPEYWATHFLKPVRFADGLKEITKIPNAIFIEVGPGVGLSTLCYSFMNKAMNHTAVNLVKAQGQEVHDREYLLGKMGLLWLNGVQIDWSSFHAGKERKRISLPLYPFDKIPYPAKIPPLPFAFDRQEPFSKVLGGVGTFLQKGSDPLPERPGQKPYAAPRNHAEQLLARIWEEILGFTPIGIYDNLLEMGVNSLKGITFVNKFKEQLGEIIHVTAIFDAPSIAELAEYFSKHYPESFARITGDQVQETAETPDYLEPVTIRKIERFRRLVSTPLAPVEIEETPNPTAVFVLSPPRSGSTLLRVMLAGNPRLFAPPELNLMIFNTLQERKATLSGPQASHLQGTLRAIMEINKCSAEEAQEIMTRCEEEGLTVQRFYKRLQEWVGDRLLVDKSPGYSTGMDVLKRMELYFRNPLYIHLMRHPYGMIHSYVEAKMDLLTGQKLTDALSLSRRELAEIIWLNSVENITEFLKEIPPERRHRIKFEDIVADPETHCKDICRFLQIDYTPDMIQPYVEKKKRMTDGVYSEGLMIGDMKFYKHKSINAQVADQWRQDYTQDFLAGPTLELADRIGYKPIHESSLQNIHGMSIQAPLFFSNLRKLDHRPGALFNLFFIHDRSGDVSGYIEFSRFIDPRFNCWGVQADELKNQTPESRCIEDTARHYIDEIKKIQPHGPYFLAAWSFGGNIAFEMTRQMEEQGSGVAFLGFIDVAGPMGRMKYRDTSFGFTCRTEIEFLKKYITDPEFEKQLEQIPLIEHIWPFVVQYLKSGKVHPGVVRRIIMENEMHAVPQDPGLGIAELIDFLNMNRTLKNAASQYIPAGKIRTPIQFFGAVESRDILEKYWSEYCEGNIDYFEIEGDHFSILRQPYVSLLALPFNERLRK